jgi:O-antigen biosynthesis protein
MKKASLIVLNWNGEEFIKNCIESIKENTFFLHEIIVVDNGSRDASISILEEYEEKKEIMLIKNSENKGFSRGNNQGINAASGDYIVLLNNDITLEKKWLTRLVEKAEEDKKNGIVGCRLVFPGGKVQHAGAFINSAGIGKNYLEHAEGEVDFVTAAVVLIKRKVIEEIGLLDEGYSPIYFEDVDFCYRARTAGFNVIYTPKVTIVHHESATTNKQVSSWSYYAKNRNRIRFMLIHFSPLRLIKALPWEFARVFKNIFSLRIHLLLKVYLANIANLGKTLKKRKELKELRKGS